MEQLPVDDPDTEVDQGCLLYKLGEYEKACAKFTGAMQVLGYQPGDQARALYSLSLTHTLQSTHSVSFICMAKMTYSEKNISWSTRCHAVLGK